MNYSPQGWIAQKDSSVVERAIQKVEENDPEMVHVYANGDPYFGLWLVLVDGRVRRFAGVAVTDLTDWMSRDCYEAGMTPREGAIEALSNDDLYAQHLEELGIN